MTIYLAGAIFGLPDRGTGWRHSLTGAVAEANIPLDELNCLDPTSRDFIGEEILKHREIFEVDLKDILSCDLVLANVEVPSWGTAMEMVYARMAGKAVYTFGPKMTSPWVRQHSLIHFLTWKAALQHLGYLR